ncbi:hypothetical protein HK407_01g02090 [Ordospora pajunii]|uniref:uncharacterized protein n=1 Tax=Ordospora pajunii TaxID=3039483 RepID=UPI0029526A83|nr:uncharacterized protein HK407_01g02090 [Ordospora pajunii]KAH9412314.1 hypothetical protein HK407_01g02090 [Ordospora pajunii]
MHLFAICIVPAHGEPSGHNDIGAMDKSIANQEFSNAFGETTDTGQRRVNGEVYFTAVKIIFGILLQDDNGYLKEVIKDIPNAPLHFTQTESDANLEQSIEDKLLGMIKQIITSLQKILFDDPNGLKTILEPYTNDNDNGNEDMATQKIPRELGKGLLAMDSIPAFLIRYGIGNYQHIIAISDQIKAKDKILTLEITVPMYKGWKNTGNPTCCITTYILYAIFCIRFKAEPYVRVESTSV